MFHELLQISSEVQEAIESNQPVIVLESTLLTHGPAYPDNISAAHAIEQLIYRNGAIPAFVALYNGRIHMGLDEQILEDLSRHPLKASRRDIAFILCKKMTASTTVAAAMFCARILNLSILVTGGLGGIQNSENERFDISSELTEMSSLPVTVICSGAKSILDLPKTLAMLEAHGISVIGYGTEEFPAFHNNHSKNMPVLNRLNTPEEIAALMQTQQRLNIPGGILVANPIPVLAETPDSRILPMILQAQRETVKDKYKTINPSLLQRFTELTAEQNLLANIEMIKSNALLGTKLAIACQRQ